MTIAVYPEGVGTRDRSGSTYGLVRLYNNATGDPNPSFDFTKFQMSTPRIRGEGIPVTVMNVNCKTYERNKPFGIRLESIEGYDRGSSDETHEMWDRHRDALRQIEGIFKEHGFQIKHEQHRLNGQYPSFEISMIAPEKTRGEWTTTRVLVELSKAGIIPRDLAAEALKKYPKEAAKLADTSELQAAYDMVAKAHGIDVDKLLTILAMNTQPSGPAPAAK